MHFRINVIFVDKDGEEIHVKVPIGMNILEAAHENDIELEGTIFFHIFFFFFFMSGVAPPHKPRY